MDDNKKGKKVLRIPRLSYFRDVLWYWSRDTRFWVVVYMVLIGVIGFLLYTGYHSSKLPYWFDNMVQQNGMWKVFGQKEYLMSTDDDPVWLDARLSMVEKSEYGRKVEGYLVNNNGTTVSIGVVDSENVDIPLRPDVQIFIKDKAGQVELCKKCEVTDLVIGDWVDVYEVGPYDPTKGTYSVSRLMIMKDVTLSSVQ